MKAVYRMLGKLTRILLYKKDPSYFFRDITGLTPSIYQQQFLNLLSDEKNRYFVISAGRGTGKTLVVSVASLYVTTVLPYFYNNYPFSALILSGSQEQARILYDYIVRWVRHPFIKEKLLDEPLKTYLKLKNGGEIRYVPASEKQVRSKHVDLLIIDEAILVPDELWESAFYVLTSSPFPRIFLISTPTKVRGMEAEGFFMKILLDPEKYDFIKLTNWDAKNISWISKSLLAKAEKELSKASYTTDILGLPYFESESIFDREDIKKCRIPQPPKLKSLHKYHVIMGVDWGYKHPTAITIVATKDYKEFIVLLAEEWKEKNPSFLTNRIKQLVADYKVEKVIADHSHLLENLRLKEQGLPVKSTPFHQRRTLMIENLRTLIEQHRIFIPQKFTNLIHELLIFDPDAKKNDDLVDSLMLALSIRTDVRTGILKPRFIR